MNNENDIKTQDERLDTILRTYKGGFRVELPEVLPPKRLVDHIIIIDHMTNLFTASFSSFHQLNL